MRAPLSALARRVFPRFGCTCRREIVAQMSGYMSSTLTVHFTGGDAGAWDVTAMKTIAGDALPEVGGVSMHEGVAPAGAGRWTLKGVVGHVRYTTRQELTALNAKSEGLARPRATCAALIPLRKSPAWWAMAQDERRHVYEEQSRHTTIGMAYLPHIARRLHHSRDLGEPFDFLTWFEFEPQHEAEFDELVGRLRETAEWRFVEREVDIRLRRRA